jgi:hypothetical protein
MCVPRCRILPSVLWRNRQTVARSVLRHKLRNCSCRFWGPNRGTLHHLGFEAKLEKIVAIGFEVKPEKTVPVILMSNHWQTVLVVLRSNYWQTVDLDFEAQPRNPGSPSSCARCRPHTMSPDLPIVRPLSIRPMRSSTVFYTRSHTHVTILIAARHVAPANCTPRDNQTWFSKRNKDKRDSSNETKIKINQWNILNSNLKFIKSMTHHK